MDPVMGICGSGPRRTSSKQNGSATEPSTGGRVLCVFKIPDAKYQVIVNATCAHFPFHRLPQEPIFLACHPEWKSGFHHLCQLKIRKLLSIPLLSVKSNHCTWLLVTFFHLFFACAAARPVPGAGNKHTSEWRHHRPWVWRTQRGAHRCASKLGEVNGRRRVSEIR